MRKFLKIKLNYYLNELRLLVKFNKGKFFIQLCLFLIGTSFSIYTSVSTENPSDCFNIIYLLSNNTYNFFSPFIKLFGYSFVGLIIFIIFFNTKHFKFLPYFYFVLNGYTFGSILVESILVGKLSGILSAIFFIIPSFISIYIGLFVAITAHPEQDKLKFPYYCKKFIVFNIKILSLISLSLLFFNFLLPFVLSIFI